MRFIAPAVSRARAHANRFPRPFRALLAGQAAFAVGAGIYVPYGAIYLTQNLGASGAQAGAVIAAAGIVGLVGSPLGGVLADRIGRRPVILASLAGNAVLFALVGSLSNLLAVALIVPLWGIVGDLLGPAVSAAIADLVEDEETRIEAYALQRVVTNLAFAIGPPLGAVIASFAPLRLIFFVAGAMSLVYFFVVWFRVPETKPDVPRPAGERSRLGTAIRDRKLVALALGAALATFVYIQYNDALGLFLVKERGYEVAAWGLVFGINPVVVTICQYPIARWAGRQSARAVLAAGALLQGVAMLMLLPFSPLPWLIGAVLVMVLGEMLIAPVSSALAATLAPAHLRGSYQGVLNVAFAGAFGPAVFTGLALVGAGHGEVMLAWALPLSVVAALCFLRLPARVASATDEPGLAPA
jgi:MFS family permease